MSLRARLAAGVALLVALAIGLSGWIAVDAAESELTEEVDTFLRDRVDRLGAAPIVEELIGREGRRGPRRTGLDTVSEDDAVTQVVGADGQTRSFGDVELPVSDADLEIAADTSGRPRSRIATVDVAGTDYRVITAHLGRGAALMVGRDLSEVEGALTGMTRRIVIVGIVGACIAALVSWLFATRFLRPVDRLTSAAEHVAATQELSARIDAGGSGEVGRLANSFNTMLGALDTSRRQQQRLIQDASHELRTPLTSLRTNVDLLRRARGLDPDVQTEVLDDVSGELDELTALVSELVDAATVTRRADEPVVELSLADVARAVVDRAQRRTDREIALEVVADTTVVGQRSLLERALSNLLDNALKFSADESPVSVSVDGGRLAVRDHGPGIADEDRDHVFDRFYRAPTARSAPGSGLGLAIVKDIVDAHAGTVFVEPAPAGQPGTVVGFTLPLVGESADSIGAL